MATFEKRGPFWRVKIRRAGLPAQTRTFDNKTQAQQWARNVESNIDKGIVVDRRVAERLSLAEILERHRRELRFHDLRVASWNKPKRSVNIMLTTLRFRGVRVAIYANDHRPPHVHVIGPAGETRIALGGEGERPWLMTNEGLSRRQVAAALVEISRNRDLLMQRWREIHGDA